MAISYSYRGTKFKLASPRSTSKWIEQVVRKEKRAISSISYVFCTDKFLHGLNLAYLRHDTLTDVIAFDLTTGRSLEGEIYISIPRIRQNATHFGETVDNELHRVMIHGVLHLIGYDDKSAARKAEMRKKEDAYLSLRKVPRGTATRN